MDFKNEKITFTEFLRKKFKNLLNAISSQLINIGFTPNSITILGLVGNIIAAVFIAFGYLVIGGIISAIMCSLDAVDGAMARLKNEETQFGSLLDSLIDRYSEFILLFGILHNFILTSNSFGIYFTFLALGGSFLVSYVRARSEGLGLTIKNGILTRVERLIILIFSIIVGKPAIGVFLIAILGNITAIQRFIIARKYLNSK